MTNPILILQPPEFAVLSREHISEAINEYVFAKTGRRAKHQHPDYDFRRDSVGTELTSARITLQPLEKKA